MNCIRFYTTVSWPIRLGRAERDRTGLDRTGPDWTGRTPTCDAAQVARKPGVASSLSSVPPHGPGHLGGAMAEPQTPRSKVWAGKGCSGRRARTAPTNTRADRFYHRKRQASASRASMRTYKTMRNMFYHSVDGGKFASRNKQLHKSLINRLTDPICTVTPRTPQNQCWIRARDGPQLANFIPQ